MMYDVYWYCQMKKKRMIMKILKKEWFIWKFEKREDSGEKGGGGNEIHAPSACDLFWKFTFGDPQYAHMTYIPSMCVGHE
jgi:hypothetical protein